LLAPNDKRILVKKQLGRVKRLFVCIERMWEDVWQLAIRILLEDVVLAFELVDANVADETEHVAHDLSP
jgi:hypothetical protein